RHTRSKRDWSSDVCYSDLGRFEIKVIAGVVRATLRIRRLQMAPAWPAHQDTGQKRGTRARHARRVGGILILLDAFAVFPILLPQIGRASGRANTYLTVGSR